MGDGPIDEFEMFVKEAAGYGLPFSPDELRGVNRFMAWLRNNHVEIAQRIQPPRTSEKVPADVQGNGSGEVEARKDKSGRRPDHL